MTTHDKATAATDGTVDSGPASGINSGSALGDGASAAHPRSSRLDSLTGLRFPAALAVFGFHSSLPELPLFADDAAAHWYYRILSQAGGMGVTFFFVLSGFVITWSARRGDRASSFWRRRFVKILPVYYLTCVLALFVMHWGDIPWGSLALYVPMLQVWVPDYSVNFSILAPGWSLATEAFFYLVFPVLIVILTRMRTRTLWIALVATLLVTATIPLISQLLPMGTQRLTNEPGTSGIQYWFDYVFPVTRVPDFMVGMVAARLLTLSRVPRLSLVGAAMALLGCYAASLHVPVLFGQRFVLLIPCALIIVAAAQRDIAQRPNMFRSRVAIRLGELSFAFYLVHFIVLYALNTYVLVGPSDSVLHIIGYLAAGITVSIAVSWVIYTVVEMPIVRAFGGRTVTEVGSAFRGRTRVTLR